MIIERKLKPDGNALRTLMKNHKHLVLITLFLSATGIGIAEVLLNSKGDLVSDSTQTLWALIFFILTIAWTMADAKINNIEKPFDYGFLLYIFWPIAFPYYLYTTRGLDGLVLFIGFISLWVGPWLAGLVAYTYAYTN